MTKLKMHTPDLVADNIEWVAARFPGCITESRNEKGEVVRAVDFDLLRQELSLEVVEGPQERYHLNWPGKREALLAANAPIAKTLRPCREESVDFDTTRNLFVEGDNLDALKLLQETYLNKVKLIYIDPPYNTGNDFLYDDDFASTSGEYLLDSEQADKSGARLVANLESNGRFHSDWLTMMFPRLRLARSLLADDGFIAVSIADHEIATLRMMLDEVFGPENLVETFIWRSIFRPSNMSKRTRKNAEYVLLYARDSQRDFEMVERLEDPQGDASLTQNNNDARELLFPAGTVNITLPDATHAPGTYGDIELLDPLVCRGGKNAADFRMMGRFKWKQGYLNDEIAKGVTLSIKSASLIPYYRKTYQQTPLRPTKIIPDDLVKDVLGANAEIQRLFGEKVFDYPKPTSLIMFLARCASVADDDIVLDFFAGSGTTADAIMRLNAEDGGKRKSIAIQLPEECDPDSAAAIAGYETIAALAKARIRLAAGAIRSGEGLHSSAFDGGYRVLKVDSSNMKDVYYRPDEATPALLGGHVDNIKDDRTDEDLLFQVLLDWGVDLSLPIAKEEVRGKLVYFVDTNALAACFASGIDEAFVKELAARKPLRVVFRDAGYGSDDVKINVEQIFKQLSPGTEVKTL